MKIAHFDCLCGISGSKILGAFIDAGLDSEVIKSLPDKLNLRDVKIEVSHVLGNSLSSTKVSIENAEGNANRNLHDVYKIIDSGNLLPETKEGAKKVYKRLAEAQSSIYKTTTDKINFRELASPASIIEVAGAIESFLNFGIEKAYTGKIRIGGGTVDTIYGACSVPTQITINLLNGFVVQCGPVAKELVTPIGAAILSVYAEAIWELTPYYKLLSAGYGAGSFDTDGVQDTLRIMIGETKDQEDHGRHSVVIEFNVDDMNPQIIPYLIEKVMEAGAADAFATPIIMKKGRPGYLFTIVCCSSKEEEILKIVFSESTTIGVRKFKTHGIKLKRRIYVANTSLGQMQVKEIIGPAGKKRTLPEFEECKRIAERDNLSLKELYEQLIVELNYK